MWSSGEPRRESVSCLGTQGCGPQVISVSKMKPWLSDGTKASQAKFMGNLLNQVHRFSLILVLMLSLPVQAGSQISCSSIVYVCLFVFDLREQEEKISVTMETA